jgi:hypothetical protein
MQVHDMRLLIEEMIVQSRDLKAIVCKHLLDGSDFAFEEGKIAQEERSVRLGFVNRVATQREGGLELDSVERDVQIRAWEPDAIDLSRHDFAGSSQSFRDSIRLRSQCRLGAAWRRGEYREAKRGKYSGENGWQ